MIIPNPLTQAYAPNGNIDGLVNWKDLRMSGQSGRILEADRVDLSGARFEGVHWCARRFSLSTSVLQSASFSNCDAGAAVFDQCQLTQLRFHRSGFDHALFQGGRLSALVQSSILQSSRFTSVQIDALIILGGSNLGSLRFENCNLRLLVALGSLAPPFKMHFENCTGLVILTRAAPVALLRTSHTSPQFRVLEAPPKIAKSPNIEAMVQQSENESVSIPIPAGAILGERAMAELLQANQGTV